MIEGTSAAFGNTWKTRADCPDAKNTFEDPCTVSIQNGKLSNLFYSPLRCKEGISRSATKRLAKITEQNYLHTHPQFSSVDTRSLQLITSKVFCIFRYIPLDQDSKSTYLRETGTIQHIRDSSLERIDCHIGKKLCIAPLKVVALPLLN